jgi:ATP-dependent DNA helicase RecQ
MSDDWLQQAESVLQARFGLAGFREHQRAVVEAVFHGHNVLCIMPTGGGKSLCYQLPALMREGTALVVSPLIALMKDQVDALEARGIPATLINSSIGAREQGERIRAMAAGEYKIVYVAPERFRHAYFTDQLREVALSFVAVDEAHCVSQWGHDFRPDYLRIGQFLAALNNPQVCGFTATATPDVQQDIRRYLNLSAPHVFVSGFGRPNLAFRVYRAPARANKLAQLAGLVEQHKTGIIYCSTRKRVDEVAGHLATLEISHIAYHGGLGDDEREARQNQFIRREVDVAVATNAFGMGIDRADIRFVVHFEMPGSIEAYYQEAGRAGRDGLPAVCELFYNYADRRTQDFFVEGSNPTPSVIRNLYAFLDHTADAEGEVRLSIEEISAKARADNGMQVSTALKVLQRMDVIERFDISGERIRGTRVLRRGLSPAALQIDEASLAEKLNRDTAKIDAMISYASAHGCRQLWIRNYFGERDGVPCGCCDWCAGRMPSADAAPLSDEQWETLRKLLSGVARMSRRDPVRGWQPVYGIGTITMMLVGKSNNRIREQRLDQLSTFGILKREGPVFVRALMDVCLTHGLLQSSGDQYPVVTLSALGDSAMRRACDLRMAWPAAPAPKYAQSLGDPLELHEDGPRGKRARGKTAQGSARGKRTSSSTSGAASGPAFGPSDSALLDELKRKRTQMAMIRGKIPPYQILTNAALEALAHVRPATVDEAQTIKGIGPAKARTIIPHFLEIIARYR